MVTIKSKKEIEYMRESCRIVRLVQEAIADVIKPGLSTYDLDQVAEKVIKQNNAIGSCKGYPSGLKKVPPFPNVLCVSINNEVIHGIPSKKVIIQDGDIVSTDLCVYKNGFHGDSTRSHLVGNVSDKARKLVETAEKAFFEGIKFAKAGNRVGDISSAIGEYVNGQGFSVLKEFQGHGIGEEMHEDPGIPNYGKAGKGIRLEVGMTLAIEPMITAGNGEIEILEDGWTVVTVDDTLAAHYENTILITENEPEILTIK
jgi:methionyl aminopeptidase